MVRREHERPGCRQVLDAHCVHAEYAAHDEAVELEPYHAPRQSERIERLNPPLLFVGEFLLRLGQRVGRRLALAGGGGSHDFAQQVAHGLNASDGVLVQLDAGEMADRQRQV